MNAAEKRGLWWMSVAMCLGLAGLILFFLTLIFRWGVIVAAIAALLVLVAQAPLRIGLRYQRQGEEDD